MEKVRPWRQLRARSDIDFAVVDLPAGFRAITARQGDDTVILVAKALTPVERLCALAHELAHLERRGSCHHHDLPDTMQPMVAIEEQRVDRIVAQQLVPAGALAVFVARQVDMEGHCTTAAVAAEFDVTEEVATTALVLARARGLRRSSG